MFRTISPYYDKIRIDVKFHMLPPVSIYTILENNNRL